MMSNKATYMTLPAEAVVVNLRRNETIFKIRPRVLLEGVIRVERKNSALQEMFDFT